MTATRTNHPALEKLFRSIADGDRALSSELIATTPSLAREAAAIGATRTDESHFLEPLKRHTYAGDTALHIAAAAHEAAIVRQLIDAGADVRAINRRKATPLHSASVGNPNSPRWNPASQAATIALLIDAGADPNAADADGVTPLHRAVRARCTAAVEALLQHGADVHRANRSGSTPLRLAVLTTGASGSGTARAREAQAEIVRVLRTHGAVERITAE